MWFYFNGNDAEAVKDAVLSAVSDFKFREGSYFEIFKMERQRLAAKNV
jgi:hypothetical protein